MSSRQRWQVGVIVGLALAASALLAGQFWLMSALSWTHRNATAPALVGFNFSCDQAEYLLLEDPALGPAGYVPDDRPGRAEWCAGVLETLLAQTGARSVRLSLQWDEIEPAEGRFDFSLPDALVATAGRHGATVMLSVGMKAQRHPEYHIPEWARAGLDLPEGTVVSEVPELRARALRMVATAVRHFAGSPVIDSWGAENEAYIASHRSNNFELSRQYVREVVAAIHANDPSVRPVAINHAQHFVMDRRWKDALADSDILAQSMYPFRNMEVLGMRFQANIMELGPLMPNYAHQAREARRAGKQFWVTELQAEPWTDFDSRLITPADPSPNLSPGKLLRSLEYARKSGAERIYLWGAEWWLYQQALGDSDWMEAAEEGIELAAP